MGYINNTIAIPFQNTTISSDKVKMSITAVDCLRCRINPTCVDGGDGTAEAHRVRGGLFSCDWGCAGEGSKRKIERKNLRTKWQDAQGRSRVMKIGEFAAHCNASKDTVRYYVNIGLLIPKVNGSQLNFTKRECEDFAFIQKLKEMQFNIKEIKAFLLLRRMSNLIEPSTIEQYTSLLLQKKESLIGNIGMLQKSIELIDGELSTFLSRKTEAAQKMGVPLRAIHLLVCPRCGRQLKIENAEIASKYVYSGHSCCDCGYEAEIENGIVKTGNIYTGGYDQPDMNRKVYREIGEDWAIHTQHASDWMMEEIEKESWTDRIILEANINGLFFIYNNLSKLPKDCIYILVDKYAKLLEFYKGCIETLEHDLDILYIADASMDYPLKPGCVDLLLCFFGENEHSLYHKHSYVQDAGRYLKNEVRIIGAAQGLPAGARSRQNLLKRYPEGMSRMMDADSMRGDYERSGYEIEMTKVGTVFRTNDYHMYNCLVDGEPLSIYHYKARRK